MRQMEGEYRRAWWLTQSCHVGGSIGVEYIHIPDRAQCDWIRERIETPEPFKYSVEEKRVILDRLTWSDSFERFVASKYPSEKRFGLEGGETLIPGMKAMVSFDRNREREKEIKIN